MPVVPTSSRWAPSRTLAATINDVRPAILLLFVRTRTSRRASGTPTSFSAPMPVALRSDEPLPSRFWNEYTPQEVKENPGGRKKRSIGYCIGLSQGLRGLGFRVSGSRAWDLQG